MKARREAEHPRLPAPPDAPPSSAPAAALPAGMPFDADADLGHGLPSDHPAWARDTVSISQRARLVFASLRPVSIRVMTLWDQVVRSISIGGRTLTVDASGSYRMP